jgi:hypothetical protein
MIKRELPEEQAAPPSLEPAPCPQKTAAPEVLEAIKILEAEFGASYPRQIIELSPFPFYAEVQIQKHPLCLDVPELVRGCFRLGLRTKLERVAEMIGSAFNLNKGSVALWAVEEEGLVQVEGGLRLYELNERLWGHWRGVQGGGLAEWLASVETGAGLGGVLSGRVDRTLWYSIL